MYQIWETCIELAIEWVKRNWNYDDLKGQCLFFFYRLECYVKDKCDDYSKISGFQNIILVLAQKIWCSIVETFIFYFSRFLKTSLCFYTISLFSLVTLRDYSVKGWHFVVLHVNRLLYDMIGNVLILDSTKSSNKNIFDPNRICRHWS